MAGFATHMLQRHNGLCFASAARLRYRKPCALPNPHGLQSTPFQQRPGQPLAVHSLQQPRQAGRSTRIVCSSSSGTPAETPNDKPGFLDSLYRSLRDFGFGRKSFWEGGVGLFVLVGATFAFCLVQWARGSALRKGTPYLATVEFPLASGMGIGTPVRIRGVQVGQVLSVRPGLDHVDVLVEIGDKTAVIPRNSLVEANQSGLIAEPLVDITPQLPIPTYTASPVDPACEEEGVILCHQGHIKGQQGVAMDDLVYICTKLARQMDAEGLSKVFDTAEAAKGAIEDAQPLLRQVTALVEELTPLLSEFREGQLVNNLEALTKAAAEATADLAKLQTEVLTTENITAMRGAVSTLCRTLEHLEGVSGSAASITKDSGTQRNIRTIVEALSRLIDE